MSGNKMKKMIGEKLNGSIDSQRVYGESIGGIGPRTWLICRTLMVKATDMASNSRFLGKRSHRNDNREHLALNEIAPSRRWSGLQLGAVKNLAWLWEHRN